MKSNIPASLYVPDDYYLDTCARFTPIQIFNFLDGYIRLQEAILAERKERVVVYLPKELATKLRWESAKSGIEIGSEVEKALSS
jgi:hypothetical protein